MEHYDWNDGWLFAPTFDPAIVRPECTGVELEPVRLPHTVKTLPYNYCNENEYQRVSGYRREFFAPKEWQGRTVLLTFGAVAHDATVFCNGRRVFHHGCGYTAFTVDLTESLLLGQKNVVLDAFDTEEELNDELELLQRQSLPTKVRQVTDKEGREQFLLYVKQADRDYARYCTGWRPGGMM